MIGRINSALQGDKCRIEFIRPPQYGEESGRVEFIRPFTRDTTYIFFQFFTNQPRIRIPTPTANQS